MRERDAIKTLDALAGSTPLISACGSGEAPDAPPSIDTLVFMMMGNRSYDHYLGSRSLLKGLPGDGLLGSMSNPDLAGQDVPLWLATGDDMCATRRIIGTRRTRSGTAARTTAFSRCTLHQGGHGQNATEALQYMLRSLVFSLLAGTLPNITTPSCSKVYARLLAPCVL